MTNKTKPAGSESRLHDASLDDKIAAQKTWKCISLMGERLTLFEYIKQFIYREKSPPGAIQHQPEETQAQLSDVKTNC